MLLVSKSIDIGGAGEPTESTLPVRVCPVRGETWLAVGYW